MRQWNVDPRIMCDKHLLGEHHELHMFARQIERGISMKGFVERNLLESSTLDQRHAELVAEMTRRGFIHRSPLKYTDTKNLGKIDTSASLEELLRRCNTCRIRAEKKGIVC